MKRYKFSLFHTLTALLFITIVMQGCKKEEQVPGPSTPETIFDLKVSQGFDWKTTKQLVVNVKGMAIPAKISNTIKIQTPDGTATYYTGQLDMNQDYNLVIRVPSRETQLLISYGAIVKTADITGSNTVSFDYNVEH